MSAKWQRVKRWDDQFFPAWAWPIKAILRAFSSIPLAVCLLLSVALYGLLASVPVGMLAYIPTLLTFVGLYVLAVAAGALLPAYIADLVLRAMGTARSWRFASATIITVALAAAVTVLWQATIYPVLVYDPVEGTGLRFFAEFSEQYASVTVRRLPGFEMTELEFYSWWPLRIILLLFVINMVVATVRRIEFNVKNLGVLMVHTGIITIALASVFYQAAKKEGDTILLAGAPAAQGTDSGPAQTIFWDNTHLALYIGQDSGFGGRPQFEVRRIRNVPRYNDYALDSGLQGRKTLTDLRHEAASGPDADHTNHAHAQTGLPPIDIRVPDGDPERGWVDSDLRFRLVGYANYADLRDELIRATPQEIEALTAADELNPLRTVRLLFRLPDANGNFEPAGNSPSAQVFRYDLTPRSPEGRLSANEVMHVEYTLNTSDERWASKTTPVPFAGDALRIAIPGAGPEGADLVRVVPARPGERYDIGRTGWSVGVRDLLPEPPFPIITAGYEGLTSPVAILDITGPPQPTEEEAQPQEPVAFERWAYLRYPELNQDIAGTQEDGRPNRGPEDPRIQVDVISGATLQVAIDETTTGPQAGTRRVAIRVPGGGVRVFDPVQADLIPDLLNTPGADQPKLDLQFFGGWQHAKRVQRPVPVPEPEQDGSIVGTHRQAALAVEVTSDTIPNWSETVWVPFAQYFGGGINAGDTPVALPDGRTVRLGFGRFMHHFPGFTLSMRDFEMIAYDHRGAPRDYRSLVRVAPRLTVAQQFGQNTDIPFDPFDHWVQLNEPLRAPHHWDDDRPWLVNALRRLAAGLNPDQYKLSQAGWDQQGWTESQNLADQGLIPEPRAQFTILGVGNNPGIHIIALGGILMGVGIPYAFYLKPYLVKRESKRKAEARRQQRETSTPNNNTATQAAQPATVGG